MTNTATRSRDGTDARYHTPTVFVNARRPRNVRTQANEVVITAAVER